MLLNKKEYNNIYKVLVRIFFMEIDIEQANDFFEDYKNKVMPEVIKQLILSGHSLKFRNLESTVITWKSLDFTFSSEIAKKIKVPSAETNLPLLREKGGSGYFVYNPETGVYAGAFDVNI